MIPRTILTRSGPISLNTARPVNTVQSRTTVNNARPMKNVINNAYSTTRRPFNKITTANNSNFNKRVNIVNDKNVSVVRPNAVVNTARPKAVLIDVMGNKGNAVKASGNPQQDLKDKGVTGSGCSRHMTGNRSYLTDYEEIDEGFELKFNLFSVSQMCDKKNSVFFTDTACIVLSPDFKLTDVSIENLIDLKVKVIRYDNGTEFKNKVMNQFCEKKGVKREFSVARTPQQNGVVERKNRTLIEATRTMLADSKLPTTFWAKAVNTTCYVQNRVLVIKPHNKTPYELFLGRKPALSFIRPFRCPVTIVNTIDHLGSRPNWLFDINALTKSINYKLVVAWNQSNGSAGTKACDDACKARMETDSPNAGFKPLREEEKKDAEDPGNEDSEVPSTKEPRFNQEKDANVNNTNTINTVSPTVNAAGIEDNVVNENIVYGCADDPNMPELEDIIYSDNDEDVGVEADMNNLVTFMPASPIPTTRIHKDHLVEQIIGDLHSTPQTRRMTKNLEEHGLFSSVQQRTNHKDFQNCLFACFLSQEEHKKVIQALKDLSWIEAMQEELL
ncbi:putative ribonuclease H-like domain-containing protein [Tanacetum coccineum]|uniref:Ribonuclease H-like domain-containing protein n=1 Tax=Tanacetum coccineum TaxID=301880 RepID=A0ABQ5BGF9_9ASTR